MSRQQSRAQTAQSKKKKELIKWICTSIIVPVVIGGIIPVIISQMDKTKEYVYIPNIDLEDFPVDEYFPLKKGNYWIYTRKIEYLNDNNELTDLKDEVKCTVIDEYQYNDSKLYVLEGDPTALPDEYEDANKCRYGYLIVGNKVIEVRGKGFNSILESYKKGVRAEYNDLTDLQTMFEIPLYNKQKMGDIESLVMFDYQYSNYVEKIHENKVKKDDSFIDSSLYTIHEVTNSGELLTSFIPYTGIVGYSYEHLGTPYKFSVQLKDSNIN